MSNQLSHIDETGRARMVDVGHKPDTERSAIARGEVRMRPETLALIQAGAMKKGDVLTVAQLAGVMGAKRTSELIPLSGRAQVRPHRHRADRDRQGHPGRPWHRRRRQAGGGGPQAGGQGDDAQAVVQ